MIQDIYPFINNELSLGFVFMGEILYIAGLDSHTAKCLPGVIRHFIGNSGTPFSHVFSSMKKL